MDGRTANFTAAAARLKKGIFFISCYYVFVIKIISPDIQHILTDTVATVISIGVSSAISDSELAEVATQDQKIRTQFPLGSVTALGGALEEVVSAMCGKDVATSRCGGALCGVGNTPICPTVCPHRDGGCSVGACKAAGLCSYTEIKCTDNNGCTTDTCSNGLCKHKNITCNEHEDTHKGLCFAEEDDGYHCGYTAVCFSLVDTNHQKSILCVRETFVTLFINCRIATCHCLFLPYA